MIYFKSFLLLFSLYFLIFLAIIVPAFETIKTDLTQKYLKENNLIVDNFMLQIEPAIKDNNYRKIKQSMENFTASTIVDSLKIKYTNYFITVNNILENSNNIKTKDWILNDVTVDARFGEIVKLTDTVYKFIPHETYKFITPIEVKFQALNDTQMENSISTIDFSLPRVTIPSRESEQSFFEKGLEKLLQIEKKVIQKKFYVENAQYAQLLCETNNEQLKIDIKKSLFLIWVYYSIVFFLLVVFSVVFHYFYQKRTYIKTLKEVDLYLKDILNSNFHKFKGVENIKQNELLSVVKNILILTKNLSALKNELTNNRNTIEQKISSDSLTKLPNRKIFELDMKTLFIGNTKSYITKIKLEILKTFAKDNNGEKIDTLILDFVSMFKDIFKQPSYANNTLYRLYGSEFVMISENTNYEKMDNLLDAISEQEENIKAKYGIQERLSYAVSIPFDRYGTIDKTLLDMENLYLRTVEHNQKAYFLEESEKLDETAMKLEKLVTSIIQNDAFSLSYKFDTFLFNDPEKLVMQEVSPNLIDTEGKVIPIATFISVAEHLRLATDFDKQLIIKTLKYIKQYKIEHDLAINISISSLNDTSFNTWLESQLLFYEKDIIERVVFSVTTFAVKNNYQEFSKFIADVKKFNGRILLKRFNYNDLTLAQLEHLELDFIRVHKDYTTNIDTDRGVLLKNIVSFSEIHDIKLLGDMVSIDTDYELLKKLNFYATCR